MCRALQWPGYPRLMDWTVFCYSGDPHSRRGVLLGTYDGGDLSEGEVISFAGVRYEVRLALTVASPGEGDADYRFAVVAPAEEGASKADEDTGELGGCGHSDERVSQSRS